MCILEESKFEYWVEIKNGKEFAQLVGVGWVIDE